MQGLWYWRNGSTGKGFLTSISNMDLQNYRISLNYIWILLHLNVCAAVYPNISATKSIISCQYSSRGFSPHQYFKFHSFCNIKWCHSQIVMSQLTIDAFEMCPLWAKENMRMIPNIKKTRKIVRMMWHIRAIPNSP